MLLGYGCKNKDAEIVDHFAYLLDGVIDALILVLNALENGVNQEDRVEDVLLLVLAV